MNFILCLIYFHEIIIGEDVDDMNKNSKKICITQKKACMIGLIISLVSAIIGSYSSAYIIIKAGLGNGKVDVFNLGTILIPILFIVFLMVILISITTCSSQKNKK